MAFAKAALHQLFSWCPLNQQSRPSIVERLEEADPPPDVAPGSRTARQHRQMSGTGQPMASPDMRQCEPWRQSALLDAATRNNASRHERLTR